MSARLHKDAGFTLIEILSVLVIIGLMSSVVVLAIPTPKSALETQAPKLAKQLNALAQEGIISGQVTAAGFSGEGYTLYGYEREEWIVLHEQDWDEPYRLTLKRNDTQLAVPEELVPLITFSPNGLSTIFELSLSDGERGFTLEDSGNGRVLIVKDAL